MEARTIPVTMIDVIDMLISGKEKLAKELVTELQETTYQTRRNKR